MNASRKYFWFGFASGVALPTFLGLALVAWGKAQVHRALSRVELPAPNFPSHEPVNLDWSVQTLDGRDVAMGSHSGRVLFVNFWATWCMPCLLEAPQIQRLYDELGDEVTFACISEEAPEKVKAYVEENKYSFPIYSLKGGRPLGFEGDVLPDTFIIDRSGRIAYRHTGPADWGHEKSKEFLRALLP